MTYKFVAFRYLACSSAILGSGNYWFVQYEDIVTMRYYWVMVSEPQSPSGAALSKATTSAHCHKSVPYPASLLVIVGSWHNILIDYESYLITKKGIEQC